MINFVHNAKLHIALTILTEKKKEKAHMYYFFSTTFLGGHGVGVRV